MMKENQVTIEQLNRFNTPELFGGKKISEDGGGNELWEFGWKVANRYEDDDNVVWWSDNIEGWNYTPEFALD